MYQVRMAETLSSGAQQKPEFRGMASGAMAITRNGPSRLISAPPAMACGKVMAEKMKK
jgi:hypothetical protein